MNRTHIIVRVMILASLVVPVAAINTSGITIYVDDDATGANDGTSWENAYIYLQDALADADSAEEPLEIYVAQGTYKPDRGAKQTPGNQHATFQLVNGVTIKGGYAGYGETDPDARNIDAHETILSGDLNDNKNSHQVLTLQSNITAATLDGFIIITEGQQGGLLGPAGLSGNIENADSSITVRNCTFGTNRGEFFGGGIVISGGSLLLVNCKFNCNSNGITISNCNATLTNCIFNDNSRGGHIRNSNAILTNCTFVDNSWGGLDIDASNVIITNCILWHGTLNISDNTTVRYSCVEGGWPGEGNIDAKPPFFADPLGPDNIPGTEDEDLRLVHNSPFIDAGDPNYITGRNETDLAGKPRLRYGRIDMGAYEFQGIIYVDDDAPGDPGPGDILVSDLLENGTEPHPMDTIQEAIDIAKDGYTVLVKGGVYGEPIDFKGKAITVTSGSDVAVLEAPGDYAVSFYSAEGSDSILKNFVIRNSIAGVFVPGSSPTIRNLTVVDNEYGITAYNWAEPDISNCIFWNNSEADLFQCKARYSCIEDSYRGIGNISSDPLFIDPANGDYHLKSEGWCWTTMTQSWTYDYATSLCIDAGDPACPLGDEPMSVPRDPDNIYGLNLRINIGAYGGTSQASMPPIGWVPP